MNRIVLDFETRSACDLKKAGGIKYSLDPTTQPTCMAIKSRNNKVIHLFDFKEINFKWAEHEEGFRNYWCGQILEGTLFVAHNALFDRSIYENVLVKRYGWPAIAASQWRCTAALAAACALPRSLQGAGEALKLHTQKDFRGYAAMMKTCKPQKDGNFLEPDDAPEVFQTLYEYCKIDVLTTEALDMELPDLSPDELKVWQLNQLINMRGIRIDIPLVKKIVGLMETHSKKKLKELDSLTMGLVTKPGARQSILDFLAIEGVKLPDLKKQTVQDKLDGFELKDDMRQLLEIRKALSLTSTRKYQAFLNRANEDDRVRDLTMYHGASTGRESGTGVQLQNLPRPVIFIDPERPYAAVENVKECDPEMLSLLYGESLPMVFSSIIRNMIIPTEECELFVADFAKIEVAVLWWLAGNESGLEVLRSGGDPYIYQAMANTGKKAEDITSEERQLAKGQILGCGFGLGHVKFRQVAWDVFRLKLTEEEAQTAVQNYREVNSAVPGLWKAYERAATNSLETPWASHEINFCQFVMRDQFLWVKLPSRRKLAYREPQIAWRETDYGPRKTLEFWAVNSKTKKWNLERTWGGSITENCVQAVARDLLMHAMLRLEKAGYRCLLSVHDEVICERKIGEGNLEEFTKIFCEVPIWAKGCPIEAKGYRSLRYRK